MKAYSTLRCLSAAIASVVIALLVNHGAYAVDIYYQVGFSSTLRLANTDANTDVLVGSMGPANDSMGFSFSPSGVLYGYNRSTSSLYTIDTTNGATTLVGTNGLSDAESLTFDATGATMYIANGSDLYSMNPADASTSLIGSISTAPDGLTVSPVPLNVMGLGLVPAGSIFSIDSGSLYLVDPVAPSATFIGSVSADETLAFAPSGVLYGHTSGAFYEIDLATLTSTFVQSTPDQLVFASAIPPIPEPATWALLLAGGAGLVSLRRRR
jgi:hypothetical protein